MYLQKGRILQELQYLKDDALMPYKVAGCSFVE